jgi:FkbM family methyltransferase
MVEHSKTIVLAGVETQFVGDPNDEYFKNLEHHATGFGALTALVRRHVQPNTTVLDVGANIGLTAILLSRLAKRVIAYEPSPPNLEFLRRNLTLNNITNVDVVAAAASDKNGVLRFHVAKTFGAGSHVMPPEHLAGSKIDAVNVPALTLDSQNLPPISFIKMDAEGHEPEVLAGARLLLARDRPLIFTEINVWCLCAFAGHSPGALVSKLWEAFEVGSAAGDGSIVPLNDPFAFLNEIIVRRSGISDIVLRPRKGVKMPTLPELTWPVSAVLASRGVGARLLAAAKQRFALSFGKPRSRENTA